MNKKSEIRTWYIEDEKIRVTDSYELFKQLKYNRDLDHEKQIAASIEGIGLVPIPIVVNEKMEIVDGQHRFSACKALGLPIYYIVVPGLGIKQCAELNSVSKNWSTNNHVRAYTSPAYENNDSYIYYVLISEEHPKLNATMLSNLFAPLYKVGGRKIRNMIRNGEFKITEAEFEYYSKKAAWMEGFVPVRLEGDKENFWEAISYLYEIDAVDNKRLKDRVLKNPDELLPVGKVSTCLDRIEAVYNKGSKKNKVYMRPEYERFKQETK